MKEVKMASRTVLTPPSRRVSVASTIVAVVLIALSSIFAFSQHEESHSAAAAPTAIVNGNFSYPSASLLKNLSGQPYNWYITPAGKVLGSGDAQVSITGWNINNFAWKSTQTTGVAGVVELQGWGGSNQWAELCATQGGTAIYQDISTTPGAVYKWSLKHTSRFKQHNDEMYVMIGTTSKQTSQAAWRLENGNYTQMSGNKIVTPNPYCDVSNGFTSPQGVANLVGAWRTYVGAYLVPSGQTLTRFTFQSVSSYGPANGNLLDDISFQITYPINYNANGGDGSNLPKPNSTALYPGYHPVGTNITLTTTKPTRSGYTFMGWAATALSPATNKATYDSNMSKVITTTSMVAGGKTVYAVWAKNPTVTFTDGMGNNLKSETVAPGGNATAPGFPNNKMGYTSTAWDKSYLSIYADTVVNAVWTPNKYSISFNANGGNGTMVNQQMTYDVPGNLNENAFTRLDYDWIGWNSQPDGSGVTYNQQQSVNNLVAEPNGTYPLYAQWRPHEHAEMTISKTTDKASYTVGDVIRYTIEISNVGDITLSNVRVTDEMVGMSDEIIAERLDCGASTSVVREYGPLSEDDMAKITIDNVAIGSADSLVPELNDPPSVSAQISTPVMSKPGLVVEKQASVAKIENPAAGDVIDYTITLRNNGNITLTDISVVDTLSNGEHLEIAFDSPLSALLPGQEIVGHASYAITQSDIDTGSIGNTVAISAEDISNNQIVSGNPASCSTNLARNSSWSFIKSVEKDSVRIGEEIKYHFVIENTGNVTLSNIILQDELLNLNEVLQETLLPGERIEIERTFRDATQDDAIAGSITNTAVVSAEVPDGSPLLPDSTSTVVTNVESHPNISVDKQVRSSNMFFPKVGDELVYDITVTNTGDIDLHNIKINDVLSNGTVLNMPDCPDSLSAGQSATLTATYRLTQSDIDNGKIANSVFVSGISPAGEETVEASSEDVGTTFTNESSLSLSIEPDKDIANIGDNIEYTLTIRNTGNTKLSNLILDIPLVAYNNIVSDALLPGESVQLVLTYPEVTQADAINQLLTVIGTATAISPTGDSVRSEDTKTTNVASHPSIHIVSAVDKSHITQAHPGDSIVYTYEANNSGNIYLNGILVPSFMNGTSHFPVEFPLDRFDAGSSAVFDKTYVLTQEDINRGYVENTISITSTEPVHGGKVEGNTATVRTEIDRHPLVSINKKALPNSAEIGDAIQYVIEISNTGDVTLSNVRLSDELVNINQNVVADRLLPGSSVEIPVIYGQVDEEDAVRGFVRNTASVLADAPDGLLPAASEDSATTPITSSPDIHIVSAVDRNFIENAQAGDALVYTYTSTNTGNIFLNDILVPSFMTGSKFFPLIFPQNSLSVSESVGFEADYILTQEDIDRGYVENNVSVLGVNPASNQVVNGNESVVRTDIVRHGLIQVEKTSLSNETVSIGDTIEYLITVKNIGNVASAKASLPEGMKETHIENTGQTENIVSASPKLDFEKTAVVDDIENVKAGDSITWAFLIRNTGDVTIDDIEVVDEALSNKGIDISVDKTVLTPGEVAHGEAQYSLSQADIDSGNITNVAYAKGSSRQAGNPEIASDVSECSMELPQRPSAAIEKKASCNRLEDASVGDAISYDIMLKNVGNVSLHEVAIVDELAGTSEIEYAWEGKEHVLAPGESVTGYVRYEVEERDLEAGVVLNTAHAEYLLPGEGEQLMSDTAEATTEIIPKQEESDVAFEWISQTGDIKRMTLLATLAVLPTGVIAVIVICVYRKR